MRKIIVLVVALSLVLTASGMAQAGKKKKAPKPVSGSFSADLLPFPKLAAVGDEVGIEEPGCLAGQEGVNWYAEPFEVPFHGELEMSASGFTGDHDLYLLDADGTILHRSENDQILGQAPMEESLSFPLKKKASVSMVVCNWLAVPGITVDWTFSP